MNRRLGIALLCSVCVLAACQSNQTKVDKTAQSYAKSTQNSAKKQEKAKTPTNTVTEIGSNYPELYGKWQNETGTTLEVMADGSLQLKSSSQTLNGHLKGDAYQLSGQESGNGQFSYKYELDFTGFEDILYLPKDNNAGKFLIGDKTKNRLVLHRSDESNDISKPGVSQELIFYRVNDADSNLKVTKKGLDLMAIQLGDYSNIAGRWSDGQKTIDFAQELTKFTSATDVTVTSKLKGNSLEFLMQPDVGVGSFAYLIYPAGTATMDLKGARIANSDDMSKDRILVMHEVYGSFFYRESHSGGTDTKNSVNDFTGIEADLESFMNAYRSAVNKTISTKKDYMADLYVSKENPAYEETLGWFLDANEPYQNVSTKSFSNIQEEGDTISFDVLIDNNGTDSKRFYKLKKVKDGYKILEFRY